VRVSKGERMGAFRLGFVWRLMRRRQQSVFPMAQVYRNVAGISISRHAVQQSFATKCIPGGTGIHNVGRALRFRLTPWRGLQT
jgi:hypothetical protein